MPSENTGAPIRAFSNIDLGICSLVNILVNCADDVRPDPQ
jgi:hypothetical protein